MEDLSRVIAGLRPTKKLRVIDLAREAGFDTTDWANSSSRSRNPKYCYAWTFLQPGKVVILNVWFDEIVSVGGRVEKPGNMVTRISIEKEARKTRAKEFDKNLQTAFREQLPVRLIIMDGRADGDHNARAESRGLDPVPWSVETYEADGSYNLVRQYPLLRYVDQFSEIGDALPTERDLVLACLWRRIPEAVKLGMLCLRLPEAGVNTAGSKASGHLTEASTLSPITSFPYVNRGRMWSTMWWHSARTIIVRRTSGRTAMR